MGKNAILLNIIPPLNNGKQLRAHLGVFIRKPPTLVLAVPVRQHHDNSSFSSSTMTSTSVNDALLPHPNRK
jgi:hypothetical protein